MMMYLLIIAQNNATRKNYSKVELIINNRITNVDYVEKN